MKKLAEMVELFENNYECVMLKVKEGKEFDLMALGCFNGDEAMLRLTKGGVHTCTVWDKNNKSYSWHWGEGGHTLVSDSMNKRGNLIQNCIEDEFNIYIGKDEQKRNEPYNPNRNHTLKIYNGTCVHLDGEFFRHFASSKEVREHFEGLWYKLTDWEHYTTNNGCIVDLYELIH